MKNKLAICLFFGVGVLFILVVIIRLYVIVTKTCIFDVEQDNIHFSLYEIFVLVTGCVSLYFAYMEYQSHKKRLMVETLSEYNKRYCENKSFRKVVISLIKYENDEIHENDIFDGTKDPNVVYDRELFLRFFEELQIQIENGTLDKDQTIDLFGWYAFEIDRLGTKFVSDYDEEYWSTFKKFVRNTKYI